MDVHPGEDESRIYLGNDGTIWTSRWCHRIGAWLPGYNDVLITLCRAWFTVDVRPTSLPALTMCPMCEHLAELRPNALDTGLDSS